MALTLAFLPSVASADLTVCPPGTGAGQCSNPNGVAVDFETKRLYVADQNNNRINVFEVKAGEGKVEFLFSFGQAQLTGPRRVAVDNTASSHDVYVFDSTKKVKKFHAGGEFVKESAEFTDEGDQIAVGPAGTVYLADIIDFNKETVLKRLNPELEPIGECVLAIKNRITALAIDSAGNSYAKFGIPDGSIYKFKPDCSEFGAPYPIVEEGVGTSALAVDGADNLYAAQGRSGDKNTFRAITKFNSAGTILRRYGFGSLIDNSIPGIAPLATTLGDVFAGEQGSLGAVKYLKEPPPGPVIASLEADPGNVRATIDAEIDPEGKAGTTYRFEYVDDASFQSEGFTGATKTPASPAALPGPADFELKEHLASAFIGCKDPLSEEGHPGKTEIEEGNCLNPETLYHYRVNASNSDGSGNSPLEGTFETKEPLEIEDAFASEVGTDSARLSARVNPLTVPTSGWFEYVDQKSYEASGFANATQVPDVEGGAGPLDFGSGETGVLRSALVSLKPGTTYRFRVKATDPLIEEAISGEEVVFTTFEPEASDSCPGNEAFRTGPGALLPDCRAYEMVSPLDKEGGDIYWLGGSGEALTQSSLDGERFVYGSYRAFGDAEAGPLTSQYLAARTPQGWQSHYILGPRERSNVPPIEALSTELRMLSPDLCQAWIETFAEPPLAPAALAGQTNLYRRQDQGCGAESWEALTTAEPMHGAFVNLQLQGTSADGTGSIYLARDNLEGTTAPDNGGKELALYYQAQGEGEPRFVCHLPDGNPIAAGGCAAGTTVNGVNGRHYFSSIVGAISADGERVFWSTPAASSGGGPGKIYLREHPGQAQSAVSGETCTEPELACTIAVSKKGEELSKTKASQFWWAAKDGSKALYTTGATLTGDTLYEFDVETKTTRTVAGEVIGVMGASEDAGRIYLASEEVLSGPNPQGKAPTAGKANIYLEEGGSFRFVATLASKDVEFFLGSTAINPAPKFRNSRVSADGLHATFMSQASLTGYDNTDAKSGKADAEVFLYDASANGGGGKLLCASCNPSGGRPAGREMQTSPATFLWAAAWLPTWKTSLYPGRVMSEDGSRLYFEARDALAPRDSNGATDVYQWEAPGTGSCDTADPAYSTQNEGCVTLISSGLSAGDARLLEASPGADDVFFTTLASLAPDDYGLADVYDARVNGGLPSSPPPGTGCEGEACQGQARAPSDQTPASASFHGAGNVVEGTARPRCRKGKVRRRGRCVPRARHKRAARSQRRAGR